MSSSTTTSVSCSASIASLNLGATRVTNARFASPHDVQIHRASSSDIRLRCAPKTRMTAPNGLVEVGSLLVEAIVPAGEASTVEELTYARVAYLHAAHNPEPTSRDPVLDVRISWSTGLPHAAHTGTLAPSPCQTSCRSQGPSCQSACGSRRVGKTCPRGPLGEASASR
jgi:hypothetical protein